MRLLYVCNDFGIPPTGTKGASVHLRAITRALVEFGHDVELLSPKDGPGADHPVGCFSLPGRSPAKQVAGRLKRWLSDRGLDEGVARALRPLLFNEWVDDQTSQHDDTDRPRPDAVIERLAMFSHVGIDLADRFDVPLVVEVNAPITQEACTYRSSSLQTLAAEIEHRVLERADALTVVSAQLADHIVARGIDRGKIHVVPNGANASVYADLPPREVCREALGLDGRFVIGFVGSLKPWHGVDLLIEAFDDFVKRAPEATLLIVGTGPQEGQLKSLVERLNLTRSVVFHGAVAHDDVPALLQAVDVAVAPFQPVKDFYFSPIKLFEYMASGACVIASNLGQIAEVIVDDANGLLYDAGDVVQLTALLDRVHTSQDLRDRLGAAGYATVHDRFTWARAARDTMDAVDTAVRRRGVQPDRRTVEPAGISKPADSVTPS